MKNVIETKTNLTYDINFHTKAEIKKIRESLPKLGPLTRALEIPEIVISSNGKIKKINLPTDSVYSDVNIKESRKKATREELVEELVEETTNNDDVNVENLNNATVGEFLDDAFDSEDEN